MIFFDVFVVVYGDLCCNWGEIYVWCCWLGSVLIWCGIWCGDMVVVLVVNIFEIFELYFGVLMVGVVLNVINIWLDVVSVVFILNYGEVKLLIVDFEFL